MMEAIVPPKLILKDLLRLPVDWNVMVPAAATGVEELILTAGGRLLDVNLSNANPYVAFRLATGQPESNKLNSKTLWVLICSIKRRVRKQLLT